MIRVLLADDHALVRGGMRAMLEAQEDIEVAAEAGDGAEAVERALRHGPDVVVMDIRMPGVDGIEATRRIVASECAARVLVVTTFDLDEYVFEALRAGAGGFLLKDAPPELLAEAVRAVAAGEALLAPTVTRRLVEHFVGAPHPLAVDDDRLAPLTPREVEVLEHVARGLGNGAIAARLEVTEATVKTHLTRILAKLGLESRVQAVVFAYETGLVRPGVEPTLV